MLSSDGQVTYPRHMPRDSINPLSHTPSTLRQLSLAGLSEQDQPPSESQPRFPHSPWVVPSALSISRGAAVASDLAKALESESDDEHDLDDQSQHQRRKKDTSERRERYASERAPLRSLVRAIYVFLDKGDVQSANRAFGILVRSHVHGKPVDIRRNNYWALGAEILMSEGGTSIGGDHHNQVSEPYPARNAAKVREYFQDLIQRFPYNFKYRNAVSAFDFWPTLLSYEIYQIHQSHAACLRRLELDAEDWEDEIWQDDSLHSVDETMADAIHPRAGVPLWQTGSRGRRLCHERDQIRLQTLDSLRHIANRMDDLLEDRPYSTNPELLRLRGMVSLYMGDLLIPAESCNEGHVVDTNSRRAIERHNARSRFQRMLEHGGRPDAFIHEILASSEDDDGPSLPIFSSLAIRGYRPGC
ncbi:hypothetical protein CTRI78_v012228 [Colletotrichum trifolii]|uniref:Uncharacterized protein n=1 Tax=Colletotrichum trifolii TaxID=5466 RepID=A0A4R8PPP7_COLTR|nr:hypothetical protein CTRI78_v012228 [Colletotrichum trifolii]